MNKLLAFTRNNRSFTLFAFLALLALMGALFAPVVATHDPLEALLSEALQAPSALHWFGTDALGRDVYSRVIFGARASISGSLLLVALTFAMGTSLGVAAGYYRGIIDVIIMRITDTMLAFPDIIIAIAVAGILGANFGNAVIALALVGWTKYARLARSLVMKIRDLDYIAAARVTGSKNRRIFVSYMLPNVIPTMIITAATDIGTTMLSLASLSFLGFGIQPPTPEWGYMLSEGRRYFQSSPWLLCFPGLAILLVVVIFNLLGDSFRDLLDPRIEKSVSVAYASEADNIEDKIEEKIEDTYEGVS